MDKITITIEQNILNQQNISPDEFKNAFEKNLKASGIQTDNLVISFLNKEFGSDILLIPENVVRFINSKGYEPNAAAIEYIAKKTAKELWIKHNKKNTK